jgi:uncharacterized protein YjbJ (UPF0337 family)
MLEGLWNEVKGNWKQVRGDVQERWGKLTDDDLDQIQGQRDKLIGRIHERYGQTQQEVERQVDEWVKQRRSEPRSS